MMQNGLYYIIKTQRLVYFENSIFYTKLILDTLKQPGQLVMHTKNSQNDDTVPWQQQPFCSSSSLYRWITMIIDIRYIIVLYCIVWFDQKMWFICLLQWQMTSGRMPWCWQLTTQVIVIWNALWYVLQWYHALTYIDYECRKYLLIHCVLLYIKKLMLHLFQFLQCSSLLQQIDLTHAMLLYCLIHFRFLKGMIWLRTLALLIFASYWLSGYAKRIRDGGTTFWYALLILIWLRQHKTAVKDQSC